jgi:hypothetical protein
MEKIRIRESGRDGKNQIRDKHPGSATLVSRVQNADPDIGFAITQKGCFHIFFFKISFFSDPPGESQKHVDPVLDPD